MITSTRMEIGKRLGHLAKQTIDVQGRVLAWNIVTEEDRRAVEQDVRNLKGYVEDVLELVRDE